jgi:predicted ATPase
MISRMQVLHYRCFNQLNIPWRHYNVLAGANGSGKSTLLDIPQLFSEILSRGLTPAFLETSPSLGAPRAQSLRELIHRYRGDDFGFILEAELPERVVSELVARANPSVQENQRRWPNSLRYEIRFQIFNDLELQVLEEFLWLVPQNGLSKEKSIQIGGFRPRSWRPLIIREPGRPAELGRSILIKFEIKPERGPDTFTLRLKPDKLALANIPHDSSLCPATVWFIEMLTQGMLSYAPNIHELHKASPPGQPRTIKANAANLPWMVLSLKQERPDMFEAWVEHVKTALPSICAIDAVRRADDSFTYLKVEYQGDYTITSSGLSGGTLAILAYTILPYLMNPPELVCLEEPENGLHPRAIEAILQSLRSLYNSQLWLSTHSPVVLAHTDLSSVIIMKKDGDGAIEAISGDQHPRLLDWHGGIDLGSLFAAGVLD